MVVDLASRVGLDVWDTIVATWPFLLISVAMAAALDVYVGTARMSSWLRRRSSVAVAGSVGLATATPFCSCGTMAVTLGMLATRAPWAPIVAFMVASPLTSPSELVLSGALLGWPFALLFFLGTIVLGLAAGAITVVVERSGWLAGQARAATADAAPACAAPSDEEPAAPCGPAAGRDAVLSPGPGAAAITEVGTWWQRARLAAFVRRLRTVGGRLGVFFLGFTTLSYLVIEAIPTTWLQSLLGGDHVLSIVAAAVLGVPAYVNTEGSLPLLAGLVEGGMGPGPAMAFLVTGAGTSIGAIGGMLVIARRRVVALTVLILFAGALSLGVAAQLLLG